MFAVISSGGKQERVEVGQRATVELLGAVEGAEVRLTPVLVADGEQVWASAGELEGAVVLARVVGAAKGPKVKGFTYKPKARGRRRFGHRQHYSVIEVSDISVGGRAAAAR
jgi:large subunit ribosomal protein L21